MINQNLKVWHNPQYPMQPFYTDVASVTEGLRMMKALKDYDLFLSQNKIKPPCANGNGLVFWDEAEQDFIQWYINFNVTINGVQYVEYFEYPEEFMEFLEDNNLTEQELYAAIHADVR